MDAPAFHTPLPLTNRPPQLLRATNRFCHPLPSTTPPPAPATPSTRTLRALITPVSDRARNMDAANSPTASPTTPKHAIPTVQNRDWMFYDVARVHVKGGDGGKGVVAFRREKGMPRGGPAGGSGGGGASIIFEAASSRAGNTLSKFRAGGATFRAPPGANGSGKSKHGAHSPDVIVTVPLGTVIRADEEGGAEPRVLADLSTNGDRFIAARGGRGGRGNTAFKTDRNRAPRMCEQGEPGSERRLRLELKLVADVGLVGFPNAGKSTLLDAVSNARPKIADYPFTTIVPNLGVVDGIDDDADGLVVADVPGLIGGAHLGIGMGLAFLRHVERCKVIVHIIDGTAPDVVERYNAIRQELELFDKRLARKREVLLVNKVDMAGVSDAWDAEWKQRLVDAAGHKRIALVSAKARTGLPEVMMRVRKLVQRVEKEDNLDDVVIVQEDDVGEKKATVEVVSPGVFRVSGHEVRRAFNMTNWDYIEGVDRFQRVLEAVGVNQMLIEAGAKDGDAIMCFDREFNYYRQENIYSAAAALDGYID